MILFSRFEIEELALSESPNQIATKHRNQMNLAQPDRIGKRLVGVQTLPTRKLTIPSRQRITSRPFVHCLPKKYSPLQQNGDGLQSVYLAELSSDLADLLKSLLKEAGNNMPVTAVVPNTDQADVLRSDVESHLEADIRQSTVIDETEKEQLVKSRRGQGKISRKRPTV